MSGAGGADGHEASNLGPEASLVLPRRVPRTQNAAILSDAAFAHRLLNSSFTQERAMGLEPTTSSLGSWHSTN